MFTTPETTRTSNNITDPFENITTTPETTPFSSNSAVSAASNFSATDNVTLSEHTRLLHQILAKQEQHSIYLDEIRRAVLTQNIKNIVKPVHCPDFPLKTEEQILKFEIFLNNDLNVDYMVSKQTLTYFYKKMLFFSDHVYPLWVGLR